MKIIKISYKSTNYYFLETLQKKLLAFDVGWPGTYRDYKDLLKENGYKIGDIKWMIVSHFHIDHAGLVGMLLNKGVEFVAFENQLEFIKEMENLIERKKFVYEKIIMNKIKIVRIDKSREWLNSIGIKGEVIITNCHSEDSISLVLDNGIAFTGDLPPEEFIMEHDGRCKLNWEILRAKKVKIVKPAHGKEYRIDNN